MPPDDKNTDDRSSIPTVAIQSAGGRLRAAPGEPLPAHHDPALDGLRGIAILLVVVHHWVGSGGTGIDLGVNGVRLFFALSGFLITGILLRGREGLANRQTSVSHFASSFYARRALRIVPLYYATLVVLWLLDAEGMRDEIGWHVTYSTSILVAIDNHWIGLTSHFWSLSVEEQFYVLWPWVLLQVPRRALPIALVLVLLAGPLWRTGGLFANLHRFALQYTLPASLDAIGAGALVAFVSLHAPEQTQRVRRWFATIGLGLVLLTTLVTRAPGATVLSHVLGAQKGLASALVFGACVSLCASGPQIVRRAMSVAPLRRLGRISYGIYILHPLVPFAFEKLDALPRSGAARLALYAFTTFVFAEASWRWFEGPINALKERYPYRFTNEEAAATAR
jgi:peptidoglycan/LPS O-acetylase OafA/YrhL